MSNQIYVKHVRITENNSNSFVESKTSESSNK